MAGLAAKSKNISNPSPPMERFARESLGSRLLQSYFFWRDMM